MVDTGFEKQVTEVEGVIRRLQQTFECPICLDLMNDPVSTKCDHKFCRSCLLQVLQPRNRALCPICKESITKRSLQVLPRWNAIVGKVAQLTEAFERDTGCEFSAGGGHSYVAYSGGRTDPRTVGSEVTYRVDRPAKVDVAVHEKNRYNASHTRKRKAEGDTETVIYIEDVSHEASRPCSVKSHINISAAFPASRRVKRRKTDCDKDVEVATTMDDRRERKQNQEVPTGNASSTIDACVIDLITAETPQNDESNVKNENEAVKPANDDNDCIVITNTKHVRRGRKPGCSSGRRKSCTKNMCETSKSELLACLVDEPLGGVSGTSLGLPTIAVRPNPVRARHPFRNNVCDKETSLPTGRTTRSKVIAQSTVDFVALPSRTRRSKEGVRNGKGVEESEGAVWGEGHRKTNHDVNSNTVLVNRYSGDYDKTPEIRSKVMSWLQTTADSVSPLLDSVVVLPEESGRKTAPAGRGGGFTEEAPVQFHAGVRTRSRRPQRDLSSHCAEPVAGIPESVGCHTRGAVTTADLTPGGHHIEVGHDWADGSDVPHVFKSPLSKVAKHSTKCDASGDVITAVNTSRVDQPANTGRPAGTGNNNTSGIDQPANTGRPAGTGNNNTSGVDQPADTGRPAGTGNNNTSGVDQPADTGRPAGTGNNSNATVSRNGHVKRRFQSRLNQSGQVKAETNPDNATSVSHVTDPYLFIVSPETPKRKKGRPKRGSRQRKMAQKQCIDVVVIKDNPCGKKRADGQKERAEMKDECELSELAEKISEAESYDLLLSQQFRNMEQVARSEQQVEPVSGQVEVPDESHERHHLVGKPDTSEEGCNVMVDPGVARDSEELHGACVVELRDARDRGSMGGSQDTPWQTGGNYRDSSTGDGSGARELGTVKLRRASAGSNFPKDYGRKCRRACHMNPWTERAAEARDEWRRLIAVTDAEETASTRGSGRTKKTWQVKRKRGGKRSRRPRKKAGDTSGSDGAEDMALIVRQDGPVVPPGETEEDAADGAVSLTCIPESTLEDVTNGNQSQGRAITESNDLCSKCTLEDRRNDNQSGGDLGCDLDLDNLHDSRMVKDRSDDKAASSVEYELDGVILVPAECGRYGDSSPASVVVVESDSSDEGEFPCSNKTTGFEPMQGFELHVNVNVKSQVAPQEVHADDTCRVQCTPPHASPCRSQTRERIPVTHNALVAGSDKAADDQDMCLESQAQERSPITHNALVTGSQKAADDQDMCLESQTTCGAEYPEMSLENREKSAKKEKEDGCEKIRDDEAGTDEVSSLRSSRKTFSLNSSPLLRPARESLELHNVLSEAAQMMPDTEGSMDPGSMDLDLPDRHPKSFSPSLCAEREKSQFRASSTSKAKQTSLKQHCSPTMQTSPKLSQDSDCETSQKPQQDDTRTYRRSSMLSPVSKMSSTPDYVSPTDHVREQVRSGNTSGRPTPRTSQKQSRPGDLGEVHHSDSPTEIGHPAEKSQLVTGKKDSGKTREEWMEESLGCVPNTNSEVLPSRLPGDTESTLSSEVTASCHRAANPQMQSDSRSSDNLKSDTTYLSSDKVVLATTDASNDITPPIRLPYASSLKSNKKVRKKSRDTKTPDSRKTAPAGKDGILQNYVDASHEQDKENMYQDKPLQDKVQCTEMVVDKDGHCPAHESDSDSDVECIGEMDVLEDVSGRRGKGQTGDSVVMETMSCKSNFSKESGESSSCVLLSCISPTWREDATLGRRVNCTTRNSTRVVNEKILLKDEKCNVGQKSSGWEEEDKETDSDGTDASVEEFSCDIQENDRTVIVDAQVDSARSQEKHRGTRKKSCKNADATAEINLHRQPQGGSADNAELVQTIATVPDVSLESDSSSKINLLSVSKRRRGPRRRISARRSLWSQSSAESRHWPKSSQSTAASTPLIPLVKPQSRVGIDLENAETFERVDQKCISDEETNFAEENVEDTTIGRGRYEIDRRVQDPKERENHERRLGGKDEKKEEGRWNEGDVCYSEMSTVDGAVMSCDEEDSSNHSDSPKKRSHVSDSQSTHIAQVETSDRSCSRITREAEKGTGKSQTHSVDCTFSDCCHDNLLNGEQARRYSNGNSPGSSDDDVDASCNLQNSYHSDHVTCDDNDVIDDDTDDVNSTLSEEARRPCGLDTSDVDDFVLPTPQKQKPILKVAMEIHSVIMDASDDDEPPSPEGSTRAVKSCDIVERNADFKVKTEAKRDDNVTSHTPGTTTHGMPAEGSTEPTRRRPVTPMGNPSKFVTALPTTPSQPVWVDDREVGSKEEWERIRKNIDADLRAETTAVPSLGEEGDGRELGDRGDVSVGKTEGVTRIDSDEEGEFIVLKHRKKTKKKKRKFVVQLDGEESETEDTPGGSTCRPGNMTSSSGLSSQSELPITQCKEKLETEVKSLQQQILQMEAAIAAGEERNHGNSNCGDAVDCHRTTSKTVQCTPVTPSGETGSRRRSRTKKVSSRDFAVSPRSSQFHKKSSNSAKNSSQLSGDLSRHDDNVVVNLVDSDKGASSPDSSNGKLQRSRTGDTPDTNDSRSSTDGDVSCHGNEDEVCGSDENEDIDHGTDHGRDSDTDVEDGEMEGGREEDEDLGLDSDEDLFAPSEEAVCIPQTLSQEAPALKPRFIPPLLTSTPRPLDPTSLPPPSKRQTPEHGRSSVPPGGDDVNYLDDEDVLPSLETNACVADDSSNNGGSPVKTVDVTCEKHVNETGFVRNRVGLSPRNAAVTTEQCIRTNNLGNSQNTTNKTHVTKLQTNKENVIGDDLNSGRFSGRERNSCLNKSKTLQRYNESVTEDARDSWQSANVSRDSDRNTCLREVTMSGDTSEDIEKDLPCEDNKTTKRSSPVTTMVAPPHGRHQKEAANRGAEREDGFPQRPDWVFIASGINKTTQQPCIDRLVRLLGAKFVSRYSLAVTHVLVNAVPPGGRRCARTLKYFQGIAGGKWVVNIHWALDSLTTHTLQPMEDYEISSDTGSIGTHNAPQRARCANESLLRNYEICCHGTFKDLTRDDLCDLAEACGAMTIQEPSMFTFDPDKVQVIIVENSATTKMAELQKFQRRYQVALAQKEWLLDSISVYDIQPLEEYVIDDPATRRQ